MAKGGFSGKARAKKKESGKTPWPPGSSRLGSPSGERARLGQNRQELQFSLISALGPVQSSDHILQSEP